MKINVIKLSSISVKRSKVWRSEEICNTNARYPSTIDIRVEIQERKHTSQTKEPVILHIAYFASKFFSKQL